MSDGISHEWNESLETWPVKENNWGTAPFCSNELGHVWTYPGFGPWPFHGQKCLCGESSFIHPKHKEAA